MKANFSCSTKYGSSIRDSENLQQNIFAAPRVSVSSCLYTVTREHTFNGQRSVTEWMKQVFLNYGITCRIPRAAQLKPVLITST
jgi:hypothetical protein